MKLPTNFLGRTLVYNLGLTGGILSVAAIGVLIDGQSLNLIANEPTKILTIFGLVLPLSAVLAFLNLYSARFCNYLVGMIVESSKETKSGK